MENMKRRFDKTRLRQQKKPNRAIKRKGGAHTWDTPFTLDTILKSFKKQTYPHISLGDIM